MGARLAGVFNKRRAERSEGASGKSRKVCFEFAFVLSNFLTEVAFSPIREKRQVFEVSLLRRAIFLNGLNHYDKRRLPPSRVVTQKREAMRIRRRQRGRMPVI